MAFVRALNTIAARTSISAGASCPIVADESRTFGMEGMFHQLGIYSSVGQLYNPQDAGPADVVQGRKERTDPARRHQRSGFDLLVDRRRRPPTSTHGVADDSVLHLLSMFGFQRIGDLAWAAGDMRSRGFLIGGTAGRTTLTVKGCSIEDGHSHLSPRRSPTASPTTRPSRTNSRSSSRRLAAHVRDQEDVFYYITVMNENYRHPADARRRRSRRS